MSSADVTLQSSTFIRATPILFDEVRTPFAILKLQGVKYDAKVFSRIRSAIYKFFELVKSPFNDKFFIFYYNMYPNTKMVYQLEISNKTPNPNDNLEFEFSHLVFSNSGNYLYVFGYSVDTDT